MALKFSGGPELERALRELGSEVAGRLGTNAVRAGARVIAAAARSKAPVRTGTLKKSIRVFDDMEAKRAGGAIRTAYAGTRVFYGRLVEFGTQFIPAQSFLRAALDESAQQAVDKMADNLAAGIERETAKYKGK
jgi:HK97 gp10 family phage protein